MRVGLLASVGHMIDSFFPDIVTSWTAAGHEVFLAAGTPGEDDACTVIDGLTRRPGLGVLRARVGLRRWVAERRLDVVVTNSATASAIVRISGVDAPIVYFCHGLHWNSGRQAAERVWQMLEAGLLPRTAGVITINADDQAWFAPRFPRRRILQLSTGVGLDLAVYPASPVPQTDEVLRLLWIGEFNPRKRPDLALDIAVRLQSLGVPFALRMLGEGSLLEATRERIRELRIDSLVEAPGRGDAASELVRTHSLIHTSTWEGLPRVMLESVAVGRRAYAFDVKGVRDIPGAILSTDGDSTGMADRIAADWASGELLEPVRFDREKLNSSHSADRIRLFLEETIVGGRDISARGKLAKGQHRSMVEPDVLVEPDVQNGTT